VINLTDTMKTRNLRKLLHNIKCIWENQTKKIDRVEEEKENYCKRK